MSPLLAQKRISSSASTSARASEALGRLRARLYPFFLRRDKASTGASADAADAYDARIARHTPSPVAAAAVEASAAASASMSGVTKTELVVWVTLSPAQRRLYSAILRTAAVEARKMTRRSPLATLSLLKKLCDHPRLLDPTVDYLAATDTAAAEAAADAAEAAEGREGGSSRGALQREMLGDDNDDDGVGANDMEEEGMDAHFTTVVITQALHMAAKALATEAEAAHDAEYRAVLPALVAPSDAETLAAIAATDAVAAAGAGAGAGTGANASARATSAESGREPEEHLNTSAGLLTVTQADAAAARTSSALTLAQAHRQPAAAAALVAAAAAAVAARGSTQGGNGYDSAVGVNPYLAKTSILDLVMESSKMRVLASLLLTLSAAGHRTLVFSHSKQMIDIIARLVSALGLAYERIDGDVTGAERDACIKRFQSQAALTSAGDGSGRRVRAHLCLLTTTAGGVGITLTGADRVVIVDPSWNPASDNQAVDRSYRLGQSRNVVAYRLVTVGTVEEVIYRKQVFKGSLHRAAVADDGRGGRMGAAHFTPAELKEVFAFKNPFASATAQDLAAVRGERAREVALERKRLAAPAPRQRGFSMLCATDYQAPFDPASAPPPLPPGADAGEGVAPWAGARTPAAKGTGAKGKRKGRMSQSPQAAQAPQTGGGGNNGRRTSGGGPAGVGGAAAAGGAPSDRGQQSDRGQAASTMRSAARSVRSAARAAEREEAARTSSRGRSSSRGGSSRGGGAGSGSSSRSASEEGENRGRVREALASAIARVGDAAANAADARGHSVTADVLKFLSDVVRDSQHR